MFLSALALDNFRSYQHMVVEFNEGINLLVGGNGKGKTNILEAINYIATLRSHRVGNDASLIYKPMNDEKPPTAAVIRAKIVNGFYVNEKVQKLLELELVKGKANRVRINRNPVRTRDILGNISTVLFAPEDLSLVRDNPGIRRDFLDQLAIQIRPAMAGIINDSDQILRQRAAYLKNVLKNKAAWDENFIQIWDEQLAPLQAQIMTFRNQIIKKLTKFLEREYKVISNSSDVAKLVYADSLSRSLNLTEKERDNIFNAADEDNYEPLEKNFIKALNSIRNEERNRAVNLVGTHRDEMICQMGGFNVKGFASHGEMWSFVLALRLSSFHYLKEILEYSPILLLDDVFAELDQHRREALLEVMKEARQVFITAALGNELPANMLASVYHVNNGIITPENKENKKNEN